MPSKASRDDDYQVMAVYQFTDCLSYTLTELCIAVLPPCYPHVCVSIVLDIDISGDPHHLQIPRTWQTAAASHTYCIWIVSSRHRYVIGY